MARRIAGKLITRVTLVATTPLSVGGLDDDAVDLPLALSGDGRPYIPGTSLAGPMRHWALRTIEDEAVVRGVFGWQHRDGGHASWLSVGDARTTLQRAGVELRDGIGIDRNTGSAADAIKFERSVLPRGTLLDFDLELDLPATDSPFTADAGKALFFELLTALYAGEIVLGAAKTRGLGRVMGRPNACPAATEYDFSSGDKASHLRKWLDGAENVKPLQVARPLARRPKRRLTARVFWKPNERVMIQSGASGLDVDMLPLVGAFGADTVAAVLPGSALKGALRSHAERIVRTLSKSEAPETFRDQLDVPLVRDVFGSPNSAGWISVPDVYQEGAPVRAEDWRRGSFGDWGRLEEHVAIDRFTGGAADGALFTLHVPPETGWSPLVVHLECPPSGQGADAALALMLLTLRDLATGLVSIGFGINRGLGAIAVARIDVVSLDASWLGNPLTITAAEGVQGLGDRAPELLSALRECCAPHEPSDEAACVIA